jgi:arylsulfatase A-like enzyme
MRDEEVILEQPDQASLTERYVEEAVHFMRGHKDEPFFLYFAHMYVHVPLYVPKRFRDQSKNGPYGAAVECIDWAMDVLLHELRRLALEDETLVIFTSDNGSDAKRGASNAPLRGTKGTTWEGGQRLPCSMRWPGEIPAGTVCSELVTSMDFYPTLAGIGGAETPSDRIIDGRDIAPLMRAEEGARSPHDAFFYYRLDELQAVRSGRWKLHVLTGELYDLEADIGEEEDVAARHGDVVGRLRALAQACREDIGDSAAGMQGANCRPVGRVENPDTLTHFDPANPYMVAMYDWEPEN